MDFRRSAPRFGAVLLLARRLGATAPVAGSLVVAGSVGAIAWLSVRPQLVDYIAVPLLLLVTMRAGPALRARSLLIIAVIEAAWVNLHLAAPRLVGSDRAFETRGPSIDHRKRMEERRHVTDAVLGRQKKRPAPRGADPFEAARHVLPQRRAVGGSAGNLGEKRHECLVRS